MLISSPQSARLAHWRQASKFQIVKLTETLTGSLSDVRSCRRLCNPQRQIALI
jgi:hypothetical protein